MSPSTRSQHLISAPKNGGQRPRSAYAGWLLAGLAALTCGAACSAGESEGNAGRVSLPSAANNRPPGEEDEGAFLVTAGEMDQTLGGGSGSAVNIGTETICDGLDDNNNGIIDDVDVGKDGLCDCIHLGFFGDVSSDAGAETGKFQQWLTARSGQVPIKNLPASATITADWLADLQVVIVGGLKGRAGRSPGFSPEELAAVSDWLQNQDGGLFTLAGYTASAADAQPTSELLGLAGLGYDFNGIPGEGIIGQDLAPPVWLQGLVAPDHPTVAGVSQIGVYFGYPITGDGTVILQDNGYNLAVAKELPGGGRVFAFADEWITQDQTWSGMSEGQTDNCQQPCNEAANGCRIATEQCDNCLTQPCSDPNDTDEATCAKGCQPSCDSETQRCMANQALCDSCSGEAQALIEATPRLWLNTIQWLTPANECKVPIPFDLEIR